MNIGVFLTQKMYNIHRKVYLFFYEIAIYTENYFNEVNEIIFLF